jgi:hypothetical protein
MDNMDNINELTRKIVSNLDKYVTIIETYLERIDLQGYQKIPEIKEQIIPLQNNKPALEKYNSYKQNLELIQKYANIAFNPAIIETLITSYSKSFLDELKLKQKVFKINYKKLEDLDPKCELLPELTIDDITSKNIKKYPLALNLMMDYISLHLEEIPDLEELKYSLLDMQRDTPELIKKAITTSKGLNTLERIITFQGIEFSSTLSSGKPQLDISAGTPMFYNFEKLISTPISAECGLNYNNIQPTISLTTKCERTKKTDLINFGDKKCNLALNTPIPKNILAGPSTLNDIQVTSIPEEYFHEFPELPATDDVIFNLDDLLGIDDKKIKSEDELFDLVQDFIEGILYSIRLENAEIYISNLININTIQDNIWKKIKKELYLLNVKYPVNSSRNLVKNIVESIKQKTHERQRETLDITNINVKELLTK